MPERSTPSITVVTVTRNCGETLEDCIVSVERQGVPVEHILVDGASTDDTLAVAQRHRDHLARIVSEPDRGIYDAMNKGLRLATCDVVGFLNGDDFYASDDVLRRAAGVFADPGVEACYGDLVYVDGGATGKVVRYWRAGGYDPRKFYWGWMPPHPTFFARRSVYERHGLFNLELGSAADYEIMLRFLLKAGVRAAYIPGVLVKMRTGGVSNASLASRLTANRNDRRAWVVNGLRPYPWTLWAKPLRKVGQWFARG